MIGNDSGRRRLRVALAAAPVVLPGTASSPIAVPQRWNRALVVHAHAWAAIDGVGIAP
ncbi:hypothetical protein [Amycolatopsis tolypomycina]|uniref:Uncharacterized protein n=1 Tax=Amycolatopsis tolypomycina TaxID=208445 RepID=A0A1H4TZB0_9PSEU|nr:hypothetical protein [Amycolatopsis tolypomycina]SEC61816.1 hypothetical protein SAMN04489727_4419 [Amycolatopsis tolypomycina]